MKISPARNRRTCHAVQQSALGLLALVIFSLCACASQTARSSSRERSNARSGLTSNVVAKDYAGSRACVDCHADVVARWRTSPMHRMTRAAESAEVAAPFAGERFSFRGDEARMLSVDGRRYLQLTSKHEGEHLYRVTKIIGGRYREDYAGVAVSNTKASAVPHGDEYVLPVSYLRFSREYRYKGYSVMTPERPGLRRGAKWRTTCIFCHNTVPYFSTLYDDLAGAGALTYQGSVSVELPAARRFVFEVTDHELLAGAIDDELSRLGAAAEQVQSTSARLRAASLATREHFGERQLVELGIGCEACHGGSRAHAADPARVRPTFALESDFIRVRAPGGQVPTAAQDVNRTCAKCHTVLFSRYPHTWEGGQRDHAPGGSHINSGEARDFLLGGCSSKLSCTRCHDPHAEDAKQRVAALEGEAGDAVCLECHTELRPAARRRAHTRHELGGAGSRCIACHMPRKNMALDYELTRYHRIGSPTDRERVEGDRPLECALCHSDKSVGELLAAMERGWGKRFDKAAVARLYGDPQNNVILATLERGKPHEQAVAAHVAGANGLAGAVPLLTRVLGNEYPLVRFYAARALERVTGRDAPLDLHAPGPELVRSAERWLALDASPTVLHE